MSDEMDLLDGQGQDKTKARKKRILLLQKQNDMDLYNVMNTSQGRNVIWNIISLRGPYTSSFSSDACLMAFNEGMRNVSLIITSELLRVCPDLYMKAQQEAITSDRGVNNE